MNVLEETDDDASAQYSGGRQRLCVSQRNSAVDQGQVVAPDDAPAQAAFALRRMERVLARKGMGLEDLTYVQLYLRTMADYDAVNEVYARMMPSPYPARKVIVTAFAREHVCMEINGIAVQGPKEHINLSEKE